MKIIRSLPLLLTFLSAVSADVEFTVPPAGSTVKAGDVITVHWKESGNHPTISELAQYDLYLCAGGDTPDSYVSPLLPIPTHAPFTNLFTIVG